MTTEERLDRLTGIVDALAGTAVAHDNQIDGLIKVAELQGLRLQELERNMQALREAVAATERQWQAYIDTLPRQ